jgi:rod shape-determining protein MreB and related proteins
MHSQVAWNLEHRPACDNPLHALALWCAAVTHHFALRVIREASGILHGRCVPHAPPSSLALSREGTVSRMQSVPGDGPQAATVPAGTAARRSWRPAGELAVDLGTANTLVLVRGEGVVLNEPSVAALGPAGQLLGVGLEAKRMLGRTPSGIRAVRPMKDGVIADFHVAEQLLRRFIQMTLDRYVFRVKPTVLVSVPSAVTEVERRAVRDAGRSAGAKRLFMVSEPVAAAIGAGLPVDQPVGNMIVNVGGGTTDVAVIALSGVVCDASIRTAGDELDQSIVQYMRKNYSLLIGEPTAETIKLRIGSAMPFTQEVEMQVKGRDLVSGLPRTVTIESAGIRDAIAESVQRMVNAVRRALELTPPELARDILENGIVLTGGGSLLRGLDALLTFETGLPVRIDPDPLTSVVRGTGRILDDMPRWRDVLMG